jgi:hypothetical protein
MEIDKGYEKFDLPKIGINRTLMKNIHVNPFHEIDQNFNFFNAVDDNLDKTVYEEILSKNFNNLNKYKNEGGIVVYDDSLQIQNNYVINFPCLLNILNIDENSFENFIDKQKGFWVENFVTGNENEINKDQVNFESRFEGGNLRMAIKINEYEYDLILKNDINSGKSYHWFFFQVKIIFDGLNINKGLDKIKFNIINCQKNDMLFSKGLRVLKYSENSKKWSRDTKNIFYYLNGLEIEDKKFYTLTFSIDTANKNIYNTETIYFSYCFPYTFSDLQKYLSKLKGLRLDKMLRIESIGESLSGNKLHMLLITNFDSSFEQIAHRPAVILTSRVHPGESNSSFVIQGVIDFLIDTKNPTSNELRKKFIFKIVPMLNPDGVINGNFRTSLIGKDLNRLWTDPRENISPCIYHTKEMIKKTLQSREIFLFCDFHGHSNKNNFFLYGCSTSKKGFKAHTNNYQEMVLSKIFQNKNDHFDPISSTYKIIPSKLKTARAVVKNEFNVDFSYCLESSIGSITIGDNKNSFFTPENYIKIGKDFCLCLYDMTNIELFNETLSKIRIEEAVKLVALNNSEKTKSNTIQFESDFNIKVHNTSEKKRITNKKIKEKIDNLSYIVTTPIKKKTLKPIKLKKEHELLLIKEHETEWMSGKKRELKNSKYISKNLKPLDISIPTLREFSSSLKYKQYESFKDKKKNEINPITPVKKSFSSNVSINKVLKILNAGDLKSVKK